MVAYDEYYHTENLFGDPYPELIEFLAHYPKKGKVLDLGCGQGRDAIAIARMGYDVTGIDHSKVGIDQMNKIAKVKNLSLTGKVGDIFSYNECQNYDIILLDSMFHFAKKDKAKEIALVQKIVSQIRRESLVIFCIQDNGEKVSILNTAIGFEGKLKRLTDQKFVYTFKDQESGHKSETNYRMIVVQK
ncbi:Tellurite resistance protein TehB [Marivirga sericea]|uniref:Tellurite resistance protein TehB n=2 Tax=Marivirga sericea TaxID=1028 RepID=A0A1X7IZW9_9BACT|nr:Tellurite resistance protein TehB [Marivirga sericea]